MAIPFLQMALIGILPSPLKVAYYRMRGARIGKRVRIGMLTVLLADEIDIGDDCRIGMLSFIKVKKLRLGNRVKIGTLVAVDTGKLSIGHDSVLMEQTVVGGMLTPRSSLYVGSRVKIFPYCFLNPTEPITIDDDVGVGGARSEADEGIGADHGVACARIENHGTLRRPQIGVVVNDAEPDAEFG